MALMFRKNDICFVEYQAKDTPGRDIVEGKVRMKACVHTLSGYFAHADQQGLVNYVRSIPKPLGQIRLVHGEPGARKALAAALGL